MKETVQVSSLPHFPLLGLVLSIVLHPAFSVSIYLIDMIEQCSHAKILRMLWLL